MLIVNYEQCTGCGSCIQKCPQNCISWEEKEFGFRYPKLDMERCIDCGLCEASCPIDNTVIKDKPQKAFAVIHKNKNIVARSTSGGMFTALAEYIFAQNGVVYGCSLDIDMIAKHIKINKMAMIQKLCGSKYVQSNTENTYRETEKDLKKGIPVLYVGTPCQIAGLKRYLGKYYENLIAVDLICHGVGSQSYFDKFLIHLSKREGRLVNIQFRSKEFEGWSCGGSIRVSLSEESEKEISKPFYNYSNYYYSYYLSGDIYRKSCYSCPYANLNRQGDFSLGDFWGVEMLDIDLDTGNGCSLVLVNNNKALHIIQNINTIYLCEVDLEKAIKGNQQLAHPSVLRESVRNKLLQQYETMTGDQIQNMYIAENKVRVIKGKLKTLLPYKTRLLLRRLKRWENEE